eukprot:363584-Amphidinium_carterae.1
MAKMRTTRPRTLPCMLPLCIAYINTVVVMANIKYAMQQQANKRNRMTYLNSNYIRFEVANNIHNKGPPKQTNLSFQVE